ncbi:hypothetical protein TgHK011_002375 [Trichoderma gracile]|nr:hypothetical protein TgHK011_002375 [Trichoderma gracile]
MADQHAISFLRRRFGRWRITAQPFRNGEAMKGSLRMHLFYCRIKLYKLAVACSPIRPAITPIDAATDLGACCSRHGVAHPSHHVPHPVEPLSSGHPGPVWHCNVLPLSHNGQDMSSACAAGNKDDGRVFEQAAGTKVSMRLQMALALWPISCSLIGNVQNSKRGGRAQPPETFGQESVKQHEANNTPH